MIQGETAICNSRSTFVRGHNSVKNEKLSDKIDQIKAQLKKMY